MDPRELLEAARDEQFHSIDLTVDGEELLEEIAELVLHPTGLGYGTLAYVMMTVVVLLAR